MDMMSLVLQIGLILLIFYFLLIRPQQKRSREHQQMLNQLKHDDEVVTSGGVYGKITNITDQIVTLEIAPNVRIKVQRAHVAGLKAAESAPKPPQK
ncbi:MAG: preprotein translocase subunit YajC [Myxococcales bacterium]|nr:MAG: preprotein translocase subunit YajC [Myxococcales bacterium]